jgi:hypothetical protein
MVVQIDYCGSTASEELFVFHTGGSDVYLTGYKTFGVLGEDDSDLDLPEGIDYESDEEDDDDDEESEEEDEKLPHAVPIKGSQNGGVGKKVRACRAAHKRGVPVPRQLSVDNLVVKTGRAFEHLAQHIVQIRVQGLGLGQGIQALGAALRLGSRDRV